MNGEGQLCCSTCSLEHPQEPRCCEWRACLTTLGLSEGSEVAYLVVGQMLAKNSKQKLWICLILNS